MAKLVIDANRKLSKINKEIQGQFSEHLGRCIYEGLYVGENSDIPNVNGMRTDVVEALKNLGIVYSRTTASDDWFGLPKDFMTWHPTTHHKNRLMELCTSFLNMRNTIKWPALFYVWGHSYEFSNDNNWDLIEEFCKTVSGQPDVWYATNIDIYYYVTAMRALVFSCDNSLVYNPSAIDVWIGVDGQAVKVSAGSAVKL